MSSMRTTGGGRRTDPAKSGEKIRARGRGVAKSRRSAREKKTRKMHCTCTHAPLPNFWSVCRRVGARLPNPNTPHPLESAKAPITRGLNSCGAHLALWQKNRRGVSKIWQPGSDWPALARYLARFVRASGTPPPSLQACPNCRSCARLEPDARVLGRDGGPALASPDQLGRRHHSLS